MKNLLNHQEMRKKMKDALDFLAIEDTLKKNSNITKKFPNSNKKLRQKISKLTNKKTFKPIRKTEKENCRLLINY